MDRMLTRRKWRPRGRGNSGSGVERLVRVGESGVPAGEVPGEVVVEDAGADLQEQVGAAG